MPPGMMPGMPESGEEAEAEEAEGEGEGEEEEELTVHSAASTGDHESLSQLLKVRLQSGLLVVARVYGSRRAGGCKVALVDSAALKACVRLGHRSEWPWV